MEIEAREISRDMFRDGRFDDRVDDRVLMDRLPGPADRSERGPPLRERPPLRPGERLDPIREQLYCLSGPTHDLKPVESEPRKFTSRCRMFVAPLPASVSEEDLKQWFGQYGEVGEVFHNKQKNFAFVKMDTRENCEVAKNSLDFAKKDGVTIRVRFSTNPAALRVLNLTHFVTNELLEAAFSVFGEIERAVVVADERGRPTGEGVVEFTQKRAAMTAIRKCEEECFLLTNSPRPVIVEPLDFRDEDEGLPEHNLPKSKGYHVERELGPRTALPGSFEYDFGLKWKRLYEMEGQKKDQLDYDNQRCRQALEEQLDYYAYEYEAKMLREKLKMMEEQTQQIQRDRELRFREDDERRRREEDDYRRRVDMDETRRHSMGAFPPQQRTPWAQGPPQVPPPYQGGAVAQHPGGAGGGPWY